MKNLRRALSRVTAVFAAATVLVPLSAYAAPCPTATLAEVLAIGTCSIGDKTFHFTDYKKGILILGNRAGSGVDASLITFTPLTGEPNAPGFRLASAGFSVTRDSVNEDLFFAVTADSGMLISGFTVAMNNPTLSMGPSSQFEQAQLISTAPAVSTLSGLQEGCNFVTVCAIAPEQSPPAIVSPAASSLSLDLSIGQLVSGTAAFDSVDVQFQQTAGVAPYTYTTINHPSAPDTTSVYGINNLGQIVGSYRPPLGTPALGLSPQLVPAPSSHGFLLDQGTFSTIDAPTGPDTVARGINDLGTIVGYQGTLSFGIATGFVDSNGQFTNVSVGSAPETTLTGIDNAGLMVGSWEDTTTNPFTFHGFFAFHPTGPFQTFDYPGAFTSGLTGVNNLGAVTGTYAGQAGPPIFGFISLGGQFLQTGPDITINCINDSFAFAGSFVVDGVTHGFEYVNGVALLIDFPGATSTMVYGINNAGTLVGTYTDGTGTHGFMALPGT